MAERLSKQELEQRLNQQTEFIKRRLDALQTDVQDLGTNAREAVFSNPWLGIGGALASGLLVGLIFGGRSRSDSGLDGSHRAVLDAYIDTVAQDARYLVKRGKDTDVAVREALGDRVPLIVYETAGAEAIGTLRKVFDLLVTTATGFLVKVVLDRATASFGVDDWIDEQMNQISPDEA